LIAGGVVPVMCRTFNPEIAIKDRIKNIIIVKVFNEGDKTFLILINKIDDLKYIY